VKIDWKAMRRKYGTMSSADFFTLRRLAGSGEVDEATLQSIDLLLSEADEKALAEKRAWEATVVKELGELSASMIHRAFNIKIPKDIDGEHLKAYLVYGLIRPSQRRIYAGKKTVKMETIQQFVRNKLGTYFDEAKFTAAHEWLLRNGVISDNHGIALNISGKNTTKDGQQILSEAKRFSLGFR